jgi:hypothetical protein
MVLNRQQLEEQLRALLTEGKPVPEAIQTLYKRGYGILFLSRALSDVTNVPRTEAHRIVINAVQNEDRASS